ncbi:hypothetical protein [Streptomyces marincola]|uniref:hypothetical protein n=1 Tax=Streptomyces marincola TaxID=2878388 RepID=UPI001CF5BA92|nr:hypothetical protein [Streptomyces marincola]UCM90477.1 hypothetical protein LC193_22480 [Streptomyces marincola]
MICPHCDSSLKQVERKDRTCSVCKRQFALEPKENDLHLHDVRVRKLAARLGDEGRTTYTARQLWYAAARGRIPAADQSLEGCLGGAAFVLVVLTAIAAAITNNRAEALTPIIVGALGLLLIVTLLVLRGRRRARKWGPIDVPMPYEEFRPLVLERWPAVYGSPPPGLVDETRVPLPAVAHPRVALLCHDAGVLACLAANGAAETHRMALAATPEDVPDGVPVLVLHDAGGQGLHHWAVARARLGPRARGIGLLPRSVMRRDPRTAVLLRADAPKRAVDLTARLQWVHAAPVRLREDEAAWAAGGWWFPVAAIPPAKLLAAVAGAVARVTAAGAAAPAGRGAGETGFLTWPEAR